MIAAAALTASAQSKRGDEIAKTNVLVRSVDRFLKSEPKKLVFADTADFDEEKANWKLFESEDALDKFRENSETYTIAFNWKRHGRVIASNFTLFSPSGDWTKYVFHYFRTNGSVALVKSELRTFYGEFIVREDRYFDTHGRLIRKTIHYYDLTTGKPKKPTREMRENNPSLYRVDYFTSASKLPFANLLSEKN